jgi:DNA-binding beta-propeller fold protein YncE
MRKILNRREHVHAWHDGVPGAALHRRVSRIDQGVPAMRFLCTAAAAATALFLSTNCVAAETTVVATGLANPRGLAFDHHGNLYVAEAGSAGDSDKCIASPEGGVLYVTNFGTSATNRQVLRITP